MQRGFRTSRRLLYSSKTLFEPHYGESAILRGLSDGSIIRGEIIVSQYNNSKARVITDSQSKLSCNGYISRNRAVSGDHVYARVMQDTSWESEGTSSETEDVPDGSESLVQLLETKSDTPKSCKVVGIQKRSGHRYVSRARPGDELVQPRDPRFPAMRLQPKLTVKGPSLALVKLKDWEETEQFPSSNLVRLLGLEGDFDAEDDASLEINGLLSERYGSEIEKELMRMFPDAKSVAEKALLNTSRVDLRKERIFSIDPPTAKDLDDAISITRQGDFLKIGVHVADVSYFVRPNTHVDYQARERATSVYLPRRVYPMLPPYLSENLCSLLPGEPRLAVSVFFVLDQSGSLIGEPEIRRSVIRSSAKLSYDDVDAALRDPKVSCVPADILRDIRLLLDMTEKLREGRIANGSISIDERNGPELKFDFHDLGKGVSFPFQVELGNQSNTTMSHDSHTLIEELMVLTNKIVATKLIENSSVTLPVVRRHLETEDAVRKAAIDFLTQAGIAVDSAAKITDILVTAKSGLEPSMFSAFVHSILGEFNRAEYVPAASSDEAAIGHWGVGTAKYMHFTSPIRRYADLMVHRKICQISNLDPVDVAEDDSSVIDQIKLCNVNSKAAKDAEKDNELFYFGTFVKSFGNRGFQIEGIVKDLIAPNPEKNVKGSVSFFLPVLGEVRSQSLDSLGLGLVGVTSNPGSDAVEQISVSDKRGNRRTLKLLESVKVRAFVKNCPSPLPKFHLRMDPVPNSPT